MAQLAITMERAWSLTRKKWIIWCCVLIVNWSRPTLKTWYKITVQSVRFGTTGEVRTFGSLTISIGTACTHKNAGEVARMWSHPLINQGGYNWWQISSLQFPTRGEQELRFLSFSEQTPEAQGGSGSSPPNWTPNRGVGSSQCKAILRSGFVRHVRLEFHVTALPYVFYAVLVLSWSCPRKRPMNHRVPDAVGGDCLLANVGVVA